MTWKTEFPDFTDMPKIPEGYTDTSWHNDVCPTFTSDKDQLMIWVDYADRTQRESALADHRFRIERQIDGIETSGPFLETDNWSDVLSFIEQHKAHSP